MKLLTLNTHSLVEKNYLQKTDVFVTAVAEEKPEIIALQEVNQTISAEKINGNIEGYVCCCENAVIREDNHAYRASQLLRKKGMGYYWSWLPLKKGYEIFEEGIALFSISPIIETETITVSAVNDYNNLKTRRILGVRTEKLPDEWFYSVHYGWWHDKEEPFSAQWERTENALKNREKVWLMGDFNNSADVRGEGYDLMKQSRWKDSFELAEIKDSGVTVCGKIDGWRDKNTEQKGMRIDQIWCSKKASVAETRVLFNGKNYPVVSDHYGVMIDYCVKGEVG